MFTQRKAHVFGAAMVSVSLSLSPAQMRIRFPPFVHRLWAFTLIPQLRLPLLTSRGESAFLGEIHSEWGHIEQRIQTAPSCDRSVSLALWKLDPREKNLATFHVFWYPMTFPGISGTNPTTLLHIGLQSSQ